MGNYVTFYNTSVTKVQGKYYIWAQTGWSGAGCPATGHPQEGLDNVVVFQSASASGGFYPRGCADPSCGGDSGAFKSEGGLNLATGISLLEMRRSIVTDTNNLEAGSQNNDQCDVNYMWGLGDVVPFAGEYLATYDLSKNGIGDPGEYSGDLAKFHLYLSASNGIDRTSRMQLLAETTASQTPRMGIVDPVPFVIGPDTVGFVFTYFRVDGPNPFCCGGRGYMYVNFQSFPDEFTVHVLDASGAYRQLDSSRGIDFQFGNIFAPGTLNRILEIDGDWTAFYYGGLNTEPGTCAGDIPPDQVQGSRLGYRRFWVHPDGRWGGWSGAARDIHLTSGPRKEWDAIVGIMYPSPFFEPDGSGHLYFTQDNECMGAFSHLDIMHADLVTVGPDPLVVSQQPTSRVVQEGDAVSFSVAVSGGHGPLDYRWQHRPASGGPWTDLADGGRILGAGTDQLALSDVQPSDAGDYRCRITDSGTPSATVHSAEASLTVTELPRCVPDTRTLCLLDDRFAVTIDYVNQHNGGEEGTGKPVPYLDQTGFFWFFEPSNIEVAVKILDDSASSGYYLVFFGGLTNLIYTVTVTDVQRGLTESYFSPADDLCGGLYTQAIPGDLGDLGDLGAPLAGLSGAVPMERGVALPVAIGASPTNLPTGSCSPTPTRLCLLNDRFEVEVEYRNQFDGGTVGAGQSVPLTDETGLFWFFEPSNIELVVKMLDGVDANGRFWVFFGSLTNLEFTLTVRDTVTGIVREYHNPAHEYCGQIDSFVP